MGRHLIVINVRPSYCSSTIHSNVFQHCKCEKVEIVVLSALVMDCLLNGPPMKVIGIIKQEDCIAIRAYALCHVWFSSGQTTHLNRVPTGLLCQWSYFVNV